MLFRNTAPKIHKGEKKVSNILNSEQFIDALLQYSSLNISVGTVTRLQYSSLNISVGAVTRLQYSSLNISVGAVTRLQYA